eukprot:TRINITY_DN4522_c0_g1_i2.p1 TRINITY_DN4522_c0_g1~~TRINITY_DN4522_c0_g1_i2.p1  ORF type:complete len:809 (+),score=261.53 TRINITY_DN4522_c0_g1_i2:417-2843(+)
MKPSKSTPSPIQKGKLCVSDSTLLSNTNLTNSFHYHSHNHSSSSVLSKRIIDNYQLGEVLGKGSMGIVYKALDLNNGSTVALKRIPEGKNTDSITKEIDLMKGFSHNKIVGYLGYVQTSNHLNLILEYVENGSLENLLRKFGPLSEQLSALYIHQVLEGLIYLHQKGVVHRDIKAGNILLTKTGEIKLTDFGISTSNGLELNQKPSTSVAETIGSPFWMAPEIIQMKEGADVDVQSDIWSVGCTILELLTGFPPFWDLGSLPAMFAMVENDHPPLPLGLTRDCEEFLMKCFIKEPSQRPNANQLKSLNWIALKTNNQTVDGKMLSSTLLKQTQHKLISKKVPSSELLKKEADSLSISPVTRTERISADRPLNVSFEEDTKNAAPRKVASEDLVNKKKEKKKNKVIKKSLSASSDSGSSATEVEGEHKHRTRKSVRLSSSAPEVISSSEIDSIAPKPLLPRPSEKLIEKSASGEGRRMLKQSSGNSVKSPEELAYLEMAERLNQEKVLSIQNSFTTGKELKIAISSRRYVRDGPLTKVCRRTKKKRWFFLFNDIIIYAKVLNPKKIAKRSSTVKDDDGEESQDSYYESPISNSKMKFQFHRRMELNETRVDPILSDLPQMKHAFVIKNSGKSFIVLAESELDRENWIKDISRCIEKCKSIMESPMGRDRSASVMARENFLNGVPTSGGGIVASIMQINAESNLTGEVEAAPIWVHDSASNNCMLCQKAFGFITRKHHCRSCGILVCSSCSGQKTFLPNIDPNERVRVCTKCLSKISFRRLTIGESNTSSPSNSRSSSNPPLPSLEIMAK